MAVKNFRFLRNLNAAAISSDIRQIPGGFEAGSRL
jgi:hypothetical protein